MLNVVYDVTTRVFILLVVNTVCIAVVGLRVNATKSKHHHLYWYAVASTDTINKLL